MQSRAIVSKAGIWRLPRISQTRSSQRKSHLRETAACVFLLDLLSSKIWRGIHIMDYRFHKKSTFFRLQCCLIMTENVHSKVNFTERSKRNQSTNPYTNEKNPLLAPESVLSPLPHLPTLLLSSSEVWQSHAWLASAFLKSRDFRPLRGAVLLRGYPHYFCSTIYFVFGHGQ